MPKPTDCHGGVPPNVVQTLVEASMRIRAQLTLLRTAAFRTVSEWDNATNDDACTDDIKAAIELLRKVVYHDLEDEGEVTTEWLESVGAVHHGPLHQWKLGNCLCYWPGHHRGAWLLESGVEVLELPKQPKNRGDVRLLCLALCVLLCEENYNDQSI